MRNRKAKDGTAIPVLGLGTWGIGGNESANRNMDDQYVAAVRAALESGYRHIDTAEVYASGHSEEIVGKAIESFSREDLFITTKVSPSHLHKDEVGKSLEGSLSRLRTDYVDMYLIHWPSDSIPLEETFEALNRLVEEGKVKHLGVSNFNRGELEQAVKLSATPIITDQVPYGLADRSYVDNGVLEYCRESGILLTAYSPLKKADLESDKIAEMAGRYGVTPAQIVLAWVIGRDPVITIPKAANPDHLLENIKAVDIELSPEDVEALDKDH